MSKTSIADSTIVRRLSSPSPSPSWLMHAKPLSTTVDPRTPLFSNNINRRLISPSSPFSLTRSIIHSIRTSSADSGVGGLFPLAVRVPSLLDEKMRACPCALGFPCRCDYRYKLVTLATHGMNYETEEAPFEDYIKAVSHIYKSKEEAEKNIYLVSCGRTYGFGVKVRLGEDSWLFSGYGVLGVSHDPWWFTRTKQNPSVQSATRFTPMNRNHRLDNIFSYHHLSKPNKEWKDDHWLITIKQPDTGFHNYTQVLDAVLQLLQNVVGSEKEARKRIYVIWYKLPFGFGAEIDKIASNKLREMPNVLSVLEDYAFDIKIPECYEILEIYPACQCPKFHLSSIGSRFSYYCRTEEPENRPTSREDELQDTMSSEYKHWFIATKKHVGDVSLQQQVDAAIQIIAEVCKS